MSLRTTQKKIKESSAIDCTLWSETEIQKILPAKREIAYSEGSVGINGCLFIGADGDYYKVVGRSKNLLYVILF